VRRWRPHVIVLDVMLPDMMGFDVARRLSAEHAAVPILFLSAQDSTADKVRGLTTGGDDYVTKPFSLEEMIARLRNILRRTGTIREASSRLGLVDQNPIGAVAVLGSLAAVLLETQGGRSLTGGVAKLGGSVVSHTKRCATIRKASRSRRAFQA